MQISMWIQGNLTWAETAELAHMADDPGSSGTPPWAGIWFADHYMPNTESGDPIEGDTHEAWAVLAGLAAITERVRLGPLVSPTSVHHPALLANRAATIDHIAGGRFVLGLGAGWQVNEHAAYGFDLEPPKARVDRFEEAITIVRSLLDNERTTFNGEYYNITDAPCEPHPVQEHLPILVGTGGARMMRITARHADEWNTWGAPARATEQLMRFVAACEDVGVDPSSKRTSAQALVFLADDEAAASEIRAKVDLSRSIVGPPQRLVDELGAYTDAGFDEFIVHTMTMGRSPDERSDSLHRFATDVIAKLG